MLDLSASNLIGQLIFGGIGFVAFVYGKKTENIKILLVGVALSVYPWFVKGDLLLYTVGIALTVSLYFLRD